ncbi:MAG: hypothetical protein JWP89_1859 [Schlesneria sp.]|nr:hypothetical protein [Schlesneria sp.]
MFNAYHKWLGIASQDQPPNHYRLLGIDLYESDSDVIDGAADRQMSFIRQYQSGPHAEAAARILNELAIARLCLLKPVTKEAYDENLRRTLSAAEPTLPMFGGMRIGSRFGRPTKRSPVGIVVGGILGLVCVVVGWIFLANGKPNRQEVPKHQASVVAAPVQKPAPTKATDANAALSQPVAAVHRPPSSPPPDLKPGLLRVVYNGKEFEQKIHARIDPEIHTNFGLGPAAPGLPDDNYCIRWSGLVRVATTRKYTFQFDHDDGGRMWMDGKQVVDNWNDGVHHDRLELELTAGDHPIKLEYFEGGSFGGINLWWESDAFSLEIVPEKNFYHAVESEKEFAPLSE